MTGSALPEPLETLAISEDAIVLTTWEPASTARELALAALHQAMGERLLKLPLGPELELVNPQRLLILNRFRVQLLCQGITADQLEVPLAPWREAAAAPQLLLAALVDEESGVVHFPGVLTGAELQAAAARQDWSANGEPLWLEVGAFQGGVDRLLTLVQLLDQAALPPLALQRPVAAPGVAAVEAVRAGAAAVADWLRGQLDEALSSLGGELVPVSAGAFRNGALALETTEEVLAMLVIPFGLSGDLLVSGDSAQRCVRRFQLALIATGSDQPSGLVLRLSSAIAGALLPDGLTLEAKQGGHRQVISSAGSTELQLVFQSSTALLDVSLRYGEGPAVSLPPLQLPA